MINLVVCYVEKEDKREKLIVPALFVHPSISPVPCPANTEVIFFRVKPEILFCTVRSIMSSFESLYSRLCSCTLATSPKQVTNRIYVAVFSLICLPQL